LLATRADALAPLDSPYGRARGVGAEPPSPRPLSALPILENNAP
jgi:hypothetical protein